MICGNNKKGFFRSEFWHSAFGAFCLKSGILSKSTAGFTLVELIVALSVFTIIIGAAAGFFVSSLQNQRLAIAMIEAQDNVSLVLEGMAREIRFGTGFSNPNNDNQSLSFYDFSGNFLILYKYNSTNLSIDRCTPIASDLNCVSITPIGPSGIQVNDLTMRYSSTSGVPLITINFSMTSKDNRLKNIAPAYRVQTSISGRDY